MDLSYVFVPRDDAADYTTIIECVKQHVDQNPNKELFIQRLKEGQRKSLTSQELYDKALQVAGFLSSIGVCKGERVAILGANSMEWIIGEIGIIFSGAVPLHIAAQTTDGADVFDIIKRAECVGILADPEDNECLLDKCLSSAEKYHVILLHHSTSCKLEKLPVIEDILKSGKPVDRLPEVFPEDPVAIFTTSGSTGNPKMVVHSHFDFTGLKKPDGFDSRTVYFNDRPFPWLGGTVLDGIVYGATRCFIDSSLSVKPENTAFVWQVMCQEKVTQAALLPYLMQDILAMKKDNADDSFLLDNAITGGQIIDPVYFQSIGVITKAVSIYYGSTETFLISKTTVTSQEQGHLCGDVGAVTPGNQVKIVDGHGNPTKFGETGSIYVKTLGAFSCYLGDPKGTAETFAKGNWLITGDVGRFMRRYGEVILIIEGREKDVISRGTRKILPSSISSVVRQMPSIIDVEAIPVPDNRLLEEICLCFTGNDGITTENVENFCRQKFKTSGSVDGLGLMPKYFLKYDKFPVSNTGKTDRKALAETCKNKLGLQ